MESGGFRSEGGGDGVFSVFWYGYGQRPGGQMIPCRGKTVNDDGEDRTKDGKRGGRAV